MNSMNDPLPQAPSKHRILFILIGVLVVVLVVYGIYLAFFNPITSKLIQLRTEGLVSSLTAPRDLHDAVYVRSPWSGGRLYSDAGIPNGSAPSLGLNDFITAFARASGKWVLIVWHQRENTYEVMTDSVSAVSVSKSVKDSITLSPDGTRAAFAEAASDPYVVGSWSVTLVNADGTSRSIGKGFAPFFLTDTLLARFTASGVVVSDLENGGERTELETEFPSAQLLAAQSPDRTHLAWIDPTTSKATVVKITALSPLHLEPVAFIDVPSGGTISLTSDALYHISFKRSEGSVVTRYAFENSEGQVVRRLPPEAAVIKLIP